MKGKKILLGVCGGIAAYKAATLARLLVKGGADVQVILTPTAREFITPLTLATLSKRPVLTDLFDRESGQWHNHVELGLWADVFLIAPASATTMGKAAAGISDTLLLTTYLSARCAVFWAPAMDLDMYAHPAQQAIRERLRSFGDQVIEAESGELASGLSGRGRLPEPEQLLAHLQAFFAQSQSLSGKTILITSGPTYERLDPVRFLGNFSSGKMGYALAREAAARGAKVHLVSGPTHLDQPRGLTGFYRVESAREMLAACEKVAGDVNAMIFAAAVADYRPEQISETKIKKTGGNLELKLAENVDIAGTLSKAKRPGQITIGFALENGLGLEPALGKLARKHLDAIVFNSLDQGQRVFGSDYNEAVMVMAGGRQAKFAMAPKDRIANQILDEIETLLS